MVYWDGVRVLDAVLFGHSVHHQAVQRTELPRPEYGADFGEVVKAAKNLLVLACDSAEIDRRLFWPDRTSGPTLFPEPESATVPPSTEPEGQNGKKPAPQPAAPPDSAKQ